MSLYKKSYWSKDSTYNLRVHKLLNQTTQPLAKDGKIYLLEFIEIILWLKAGFKYGE